jgi:hypothetical protein
VPQHPPLRLDLIPEPSRVVAEEAYEHADMYQLIGLVAPHKAREFVDDNLPALAAIGELEQATLYAYTRTDIWSSRETERWKVLFRLCDRAKLRACGSPFEVRHMYRLYRGVNGVGSGRREYSLSWTATFDVAKCFALRQMPGKVSLNPEVLEITVPHRHILAHVRNRDEDEYIVELPAGIVFTRHKVT